MKSKHLLLGALLLITSTLVWGQKKSHQQREELREQRQQAYMAKLKDAFMQQQFTFVAMQMQTNFGPISSISGINNYIDLYPEDLDVNLPYESTNMVTPYMEDIYFTTIHYTYQVKYSSDGKTAYIDIEAQNVIDLDNNDDVEDADASDGNLNWGIRMQVSTLTGATTVTITPTFGNQMQYIGTLQLTN